MMQWKQEETMGADGQHRGEAATVPETGVGYLAHEKSQDHEQAPELAARVPEQAPGTRPASFDWHLCQAGHASAEVPGIF